MLIYSMDTSGWTSLKRGYPASNFPSLWRNVDYLAQNSRLISPHEVYVELEKQDDELSEALKDKVPEVYPIGDCVEPGKVKNAIWGGFRTARLI